MFRSTSSAPLIACREMVTSFSFSSRLRAVTTTASMVVFEASAPAGALDSAACPRVAGASAASATAADIRSRALEVGTDLRSWFNVIGRPPKADSGDQLSSLHDRHEHAGI